MVPGSVGCRTLRWWTVYRQPLQLVLWQFCAAFTKSRTDATANDSLQLFSVVGHREAPPWACGVHELRNDNRLEDDVDWGSCHAMGLEYSQSMDTLWIWRVGWSHVHVHWCSLLTCSRTDRVLVTVTLRIFMTPTQLMLAGNAVSWYLARLRVKLLACAHVSMLPSSSNLL